MVSAGLKFLATLFAVWIFAVESLAIGSAPWASVPPYSLDLVDYLQSEPLTSASVYPVQYPAAEIPGGAPGVAWVRTLGQKRVKMTFRYEGIYEHDATVAIGPCEYASASGTFSVTASPATFLVHFTLGGSATVEFELAGIPNFVTLGGFSLPFSCTSVYTGLGGNAGTRLYLTDATPLGTSYGHQVPVWTDVLEDACLWATGQTGPAACRQWCTFKLFHSFVFVYDPDKPYYSVRQFPIVSFADHRYKFSLKLFFEHRGSPPYTWTNGDCRDVSFYSQIATSALGVPLDCFQEWPTNPGYPVPSLAFETNPGCGIGNDSTIWANYEQWRFNFHQHNASPANSTYDACVAQWVDLGGNPYQNPPIDWPLQTPPTLSYWQTEILPHPPTGSWFRGVAWRYSGQTAPGGAVVVRSLVQSYLVGYLP